MATFAVFMVGGFILSMFFEDYLLARRAERDKARGFDTPPRRRRLSRRWLDPDWDSLELRRRMRRYALGFGLTLLACIALDVVLFPIEDALMNSIFNADPAA